MAQFQGFFAPKYGKKIWYGTPSFRYLKWRTMAVMAVGVFQGMASWCDPRVRKWMPVARRHGKFHGDKTSHEVNQNGDSCIRVIPK
jgi:hypothetical protein